MKDEEEDDAGQSTNDIAGVEVVDGMEEEDDVGQSVNGKAGVVVVMMSAVSTG